MPLRVEVKDETVQVWNFHPAIYFALMVVKGVWVEIGFSLLQITSGHEQLPVHGLKSLHYVNGAADLHSKTLGTPEQRQLAADLVDKRLGPDFDFILENVGEDNEHFHLELQPRRRKSDGTVG